MAQVAEPSKGLLHLLERSTPFGFLRQPVVEQQANIAVRDADGGPKLMRKYMENFVDLDGHGHSAA
jgi:hypothetical protein